MKAVYCPNKLYNFYTDKEVFSILVHEPSLETHSSHQYKVPTFKRLAYARFKLEKQDEARSLMTTLIYNLVFMCVRDVALVYNCI